MVRWVSKLQEETEMARRGENIHKRKDGRWEGRYIKARTPEGKIQWGYIYGTAYAEVKRVLIQKKAEAGFYNLKRTDLTFEALAEVWLHSLRNSIKESTYAHYSYTLHKYLLPVLSEVLVASLEESFLEQAMQQIIAPADAAHKPLGSSSARECLSMLRRICKYAAHLRLIRPMELEVALPKAILTAKAAENQYVGVSCGKLDQSCEVLSKKNHLLYLDTKDDSYELIPTSEKMKPYKVAIFFSGLERSLKNSKYNLRQDECKAAAYALMGYAGMDYDTFANTRLRDVPYLFVRNAVLMPEPNRKLIDCMYEAAWYSIYMFKYGLDRQKVPAPWYDTKEHDSGKGRVND